MADEITVDSGSISREQLDTKLCPFLDENFHEDLSNVRQCLERMKQEKSELEKQLKSSNSTSIEQSCVDKAINEAKTALQNVDKIQFSLNELNSSIAEHNSNIHGLVNQLESLNNTVKELENLSSYMKWILKVENLSNEIHHAIETGSLKKATEELLCLKRLLDKLHGSSCKHLKQFVANTLKHWNKLVIDKLSKEFDEVLKVLKWPFTSGSTAPSLAAKSEVFSRLENLFLMLLKISEIDYRDPECDEDSNGAKQPKIISLPMELLMRPLKKRFQYHFYGKRQTNNLEKPEWFYTQILNWLRDHEDFLVTTIQPILNKADRQWKSAQVQFTEGLLEVVIHKMKQTVRLLLDDERIFSHFVDETLIFDQEFRNGYSYQTENNDCLNVLSQPPVFKKWIALEKKYAMENVLLLLSTEKAWNPRYQDASDVDDQKVPECVENFVSLLLGITDRYKNLPMEEERLAFVNVQLDLIFFFTASLEEVMEQHADTPLDPCFLFIMNSTNYLVTILQGWSEQTFFVKLYYMKRQMAAEKEKQETRRTSSDNKPSAADERIHDSVSETIDDDESYGTLFDEAIDLLKALENKMLSILGKHVFTGFKMKSESYKKESWHSFPSQKDLTIMCLSPSLCDMMIYLREILEKLKQELVESLFSILWKQLADDVSEYLFKEVILNSHFNEGGAAQLKFDIHKNLFVLFGQFTRKPENYLRKLKEACILLNLMPGSAVLLKETLEEYTPKTKNETSCTALEELGVYRLSVSEVLNVLNSRINWNK